MKIKMDYVGPLYVYSKFNKFQFVFSTIYGEFIEQLLHVAHMKKGLLRYCSDVCSGTICHTGNEISSGRNDYLSPFL